MATPFNAKSQSVNSLNDKFTLLIHVRLLKAKVLSKGHKWQKILRNDTVKPSLMATFPQWPNPFNGHVFLSWLLIHSLKSSYWKPLHNSHLFTTARKFGPKVAVVERFNCISVACNMPCHWLWRQPLLILTIHVHLCLWDPSHEPFVLPIDGHIAILTGFEGRKKTKLDKSTSWFTLNLSFVRYNNYYNCVRIWHEIRDHRFPKKFVIVCNTLFYHVNEQCRILLFITSWACFVAFLFSDDNGGNENEVVVQNKVEKATVNEKGHLILLYNFK